MNKDFDAVKIIGIPALLEQTAEEASELAQACLKMSRKLRGENPTPKNMIQVRNDLLEEVADVMNCLEQIVEYADIFAHSSLDSMRISKLERWEQRLNTVDVNDVPEILKKKMNIHHPTGKLPTTDKEMTFDETRKAIVDIGGSEFKTMCEMFSGDEDD